MQYKFLGFAIISSLLFYACESDVQSEKAIEIALGINDYDGDEMTIDEVFEYFPQHLSVKLESIEIEDKDSLLFKMECFFKDSVLTDCARVYCVWDDTLTFDEFVMDTTDRVYHAHCGDRLKLKKPSVGIHFLKGIISWCNNSYSFSNEWAEEVRVE